MVNNFTWQSYSDLFFCTEIQLKNKLNVHRANLTGLRIQMEYLRSISLLSFMLCGQLFNDMANLASMFLDSTTEFCSQNHRQLWSFPTQRWVGTSQPPKRHAGISRASSKNNFSAVIIFYPSPPLSQVPWRIPYTGNISKCQSDCELKTPDTWS